MKKLREIGSYLVSLSRNSWVRFILQGFMIVFCLFYLGMHLNEITDSITGLSINYSFIMLSLLFTLLSIFWGVLGWWFTLKGLGQSLEMSVTARVHLFSNLAKYLPGYGWQLIGKAYLTSELGVPFEIVSLGMVLELFQLLWTGFTILVFMTPSELFLEVTNIFIPQNCFYFYGSISFVIQFLSIRILPGLLKRFNCGQIADNLNKVALYCVIFCMLAGWLALGFAFWLLGTALSSSVSIVEIPFFIFALASSMLSGLIIFVVPGGFGIRESVMVWVLGFHMPVSLAIVAAGLSRLLVIIGELVSALLIKVLLRHSNSR